MKRRLIAALLVTEMAVTAAVGCGNSGSDDSGKEETKTEANEPGDSSDEDADAG